MRKSIKAVSALACAFAIAVTATLVPTMTAKAEMPTYSETMENEEKTPYSAVEAMSLPDGEVYYSLAGGFTKVEWGPLAVDNLMTATDYAGVYSATYTIPAYKDTDADRSKNEFKLVVVNNSIFGTGWDHSLIAGTAFYGDNMTRFRVPVEKETKATIYWDTATGAVVIKDEEGNTVDYMLSFVGYDNELKWMTVDEMSKSSWGDYAQDKAQIAQGAGCTDIPDLKSINAALEQKLAGGAGSTPDATTEAPAATQDTQTTAASQQTTAANQSTKTGDVAPVAMVVTLCAAAVIVVVAAKKKEA